MFEEFLFKLIIVPFPPLHRQQRFLVLGSLLARANGFEVVGNEGGTSVNMLL